MGEAASDGGRHPDSGGDEYWLKEPEDKRGRTYGVDPAEELPVDITNCSTMRCLGDVCGLGDAMERRATSESRMGCGGMALKYD